MSAQYLLTEDQISIQEMVREFAQKELAPVVKECDEQSRFPVEVYKKITEMGINSMFIPEEYGGMGLDTVTCCLIREELGRVDAGFTIGPVDTQIFETFPLFSLQTSLLVYDTHPLARKEEVDLRELEGVPMVIESDAFKIHHLFIGACREAGFEPNILFCTSGSSLCLKLCAQKRGCSLVVNEISSDMRAAGLKKVKLRQNIPWKAVMICQKDEAHFPQIQRLRRYTVDYLGKIQIRKKNVDF